MTMREELLSILEARLGETTGVYVNAGVDAEAYYGGLRSSIRESLCDPFLVNAKVMPPGFEGHDEGAELAGYCLAHKAGYWLVYRPEDAAFYCFWGATASTLGAHGVTGSPLYCWSA